MMSCTRLNVGSTKGGGPREEKEAFNPSKSVMGEHEGT